MIWCQQSTKTKFPRKRSDWTEACKKPPTFKLNWFV